MNGAQSVRQALSAALSSDDRVHLLGEALELSVATRGLMAEAPAQVHLLPSADAGLIGVAVGMAVAGAHPVVELADTRAVWGVLQQLGQEAACLAQASDFPHTLVLRVPWAPGQPDPTDLLLALTHIAVAAPSSAGEAASLVQAALASPGFTVLLEPGEVMAASAPAWGEPLPLGKARVLREGHDATLLAFGAAVAVCLEAAQDLAAEGIEVDVVDLRSLRPLDSATIAPRLHHTGRAVLVGAGAALLPEIITQAFLRLEAPPTTSDARVSAVIEAVRTAITY